MALTRDFKATVQARVQAELVFREALLREGIETMLSGDVDTGKTSAGLHQGHSRI